MADVKLFLSCVSDEFADYRDNLRRALTRPNVEIKIQEEFKAMGGDTLAMLETYVESCDVVVHFLGEMAGSAPKAASVDDLLKRRPELAARLAEKGMDREALGRLTYTQWEAWLAIGFNKHGAKKNLVIAAPEIGLKHSAAFAPTDSTRCSQADHLSRLRAINFYPAERFTSADNLVAQVLASAVLDALRKADAAPKAKPRNLPFAPLGNLFAGRDEDLAELHTALLGAKGAPVALCGLGGIGKTRLAIEYAWSREAIYSALLFVSASDGAALNAGLAALTAFEILDLPEKEARDDATKITAALRWLESNPTWLMILDNVDDSAAVAEVAKLMPRLKGGHVVITARASNFPAFVRKLEVSTLDENAAAQFLLDRTDADRSKSKDDAALARTLARELGGLALGLEQAGAHIATDRIGFARYLKLWSESREKALAWADETVTGSDRTLATTWATSVSRLSPESRCLFDLLSFMAPDPIPGWFMGWLDEKASAKTTPRAASLFGSSLITRLLDRLASLVPNSKATSDTTSSVCAHLLAYSLIACVSAEKGGQSGFIVHRLVQDFARRAMPKKRRLIALSEAIDLVDVASSRNPWDVRNWPILDAIVPHALTVARNAEASGIDEPDGLLNRLGASLHRMGKYVEAEPLLRRALAINEKTFGPDHPDVSTPLNNLAQLLTQMNCFAEAEHLMRRAVAIDEKSSYPNQRNVVTHISNLAALLYRTNQIAEAESLMRQALAICERLALFETDFLAIRLNNLAALLHSTNRLAESEPMMRRALAIFEDSLGADHPSVANCLNNLARLLQDTNRFAEAEPLVLRAFEISEESYGTDHPEAATNLATLARQLESTNRQAEAKPFYQRVYAIFERTLGPEHPNTITARNNLAALQAALGKDAAEGRTRPPLAN